MPPLRLPADPDARVRGHRHSSSGRRGQGRTSSRKGCTRSRTAAAAHSPCARRAQRRSAAPTSSTGCTVSRSRRALHIGTMYRYWRRSAGGTASTGGCRSRRSARRALGRRGGDPALPRAPRTAGVDDFELALNSIGCRECRPAYLGLLRAWLDANLDRLDASTREKAAASPLRVFDNLEAKPPATRRRPSGKPRRSIRSAPRAEHFAAVRRDLDACDVAYALVPTLVRGLDYYTRTTWEFVGPDEGAQSTLSGGGRYDGLVEENQAPRRRESASVPGSSGSCSRSSTRASRRALPRSTSSSRSRTALRASASSPGSAISARSGSQAIRTTPDAR